MIKKSFRRMLVPLFGIGFVVGVLVLATIKFGSLHNVLAALSGKSFNLSPRVLHVECEPADSPYEFNAELTNLTSNPIRIVGATWNCTCGVVEGVPADVEPYAATTMKVRLKNRRQVSATDVLAVIYVEVDRKMTVADLCIKGDHK